MNSTRKWNWSVQIEACHYKIHTYAMHKTHLAPYILCPLHNQLHPLADTRTHTHPHPTHAPHNTPTPTHTYTCTHTCTQTWAPYTGTYIDVSWLPPLHLPTNVIDSKCLVLAWLPIVQLHMHGPWSNDQGKNNEIGGSHDQRWCRCRHCMHRPLAHAVISSAS